MNAQNPFVKISILLHVTKVVYIGTGVFVKYHQIPILSFPPHLLTATEWCGDLNLNLKLICRLLNSFVNIICQNELSVQF